MKEFANGRKDESEEFFGFRLYSARMVIECAFGRLKARFKERNGYQYQRTTTSSKFMFCFKQFL